MEKPDEQQPRTDGCSVTTKSAQEEELAVHPRRDPDSQGEANECSKVSVSSREGWPMQAPGPVLLGHKKLPELRLSSLVLQPLVTTWPQTLP